MATKINFTGSQGTGKTTALKALQKDPNFEGFEFVTEVVRNYAKELGLKINKEGTLKTQKILFAAYANLLDKGNSFVSDRCILDVCSYTLAKVESQPFNSIEGLKSYNCSKEQIRFIKTHKDLLGLVFYFPIEFPIEDDSVRSVDLEYQKEIDENIVYLLKECRIPYIKVTGTVEERIEIIKATLSELP